MRVPLPDFLALLRTLFNHEIDFIVVGGVGAVLHGGAAGRDLKRMNEPKGDRV